MKRILILAACLLALCVSVSAAEATVNHMKLDVTVDSDGTYRAVEAFDLSVVGTENRLVFPLPQGAKRASLVGCDAKKESDGVADVLAVESSLGITGSRSFTLQYSGRVQVEEAEDRQQLLLQLLPSRWGYPIESFEFTVTMPAEFDQLPTFESGYFGDVIEDMMTLSVKDKLICGKVSGGLKDHESLQLALDLEKDYFSGTYAAWSFRWISLLLIGLCLLGAWIYWYLRLRTRLPGKAVRTVPPEACTPGEVPIILYGAKADFNLLTLHWATLGYLTISLSGKGNVLLTKRIAMGNERRTVEQKLFAMLFSRGPVCDGASLLYKKTAQKAQNVLYRYWARRIYDKNSGNVLLMQLLMALAGGIAGLESVNQILPAMTLRWLLLAVCGLLAAAISFPVMQSIRWYLQKKKLHTVISALCACVLLVLSARSGFAFMLLIVLAQILTGAATLHGGQLSAFGAQLVQETGGFRRYLLNVSAKRLRAVLQRDQQYYYRTLPYAEAMGLGLNFSRLFGETELEACDWYQEANPLPKLAPGFYEHMQETLALLKLSVDK